METCRAWALALCFILLVQRTGLVRGQGGGSDNPMLYPAVSAIGTPNWAELKSANGIKFSNRHNHASCMYTPPGSKSPRLWVTGGKVEKYQRYDMIYSVKQADVWYSEPDVTFDIALGQNWQQMQLMTGDFYAQNADVVQPGKIAPWFQRFGHTLTAYDSNGDGFNDMMLLMGGFAPMAMNDIWVTVDGSHWTFHEAPWPGRGWHSTVVNNGTLYVMGGSPFTNDVWRLESIKKVNRTVDPLTRASFSPYTYESKWKQLDDAPWAPRAGMHVVSQWYWNFTGPASAVTFRRARDPTRVPESELAVQRIVLVGGYGGWQTTDPKFDGMFTRGDVWTCTNGTDWVLLNDSAIPGRAWQGMTVFTRDTQINAVTPSMFDASLAAGTLAPPRIWIFGGAYVGGTTKTTGITLQLKGWTDALWSRDGVTWTQVNFQEGAGIRGAYDNFVKFYSSQLWSKTMINGQSQYLGLWGQTLEMFNNTLILIAGDKTGAGTMTSTTYGSLNGILCDRLGVVCSGAGVCGPQNRGCICNPGTGLIGEYCDVPCSSGNCKWPV